MLISGVWWKVDLWKDVHGYVPKMRTFVHILTTFLVLLRELAWTANVPLPPGKLITSPKVLQCILYCSKSMQTYDSAKIFSGGHLQKIVVRP